MYVPNVMAIRTVVVEVSHSEPKRFINFTGKVRGSPKSIIVYNSSSGDHGISVQNCTDISTTIHPPVVEIFQSGPKW